MNNVVFRLIVQAMSTLAVAGAALQFRAWRTAKYVTNCGENYCFAPSFDMSFSQAAFAAFAASLAAVAVFWMAALASAAAL